MRKAVIDVGTNSTRLYVAEVDGRQQQAVFKKLETTRLGEGIGASRTMGELPLARTTDAIRDFVREAKAAGVSDRDVYLYATAVVREADNKSEFLRLVREKTGYVPEILPGEAEGRIAYRGASIGYPGYGVIDIGGGSTEVVCGEGKTVRALSQKIGGVRLKGRFGMSDQVAIAPVKAYCRTFLDAYKATGIDRAKGLIGVSGTPTTLAALVQGENVYRAETVQGFHLTAEAMERELEKLAAMDQPTRRAYAGEFAPRADIIVYGGCMLSAFMEYFGFSEIVASDRDSLEGFLEEKM